MRSDLPTRKATLRFFEGDLHTIDKFYPALGHNKVVRQLVHNFVRGLEEKASQKLDKVDLTNVNIPDDILSE